MLLENKLGIKNSIELAQVEEKLTKKRIFELFKNKTLDKLEIGTYKSLAKIHEYIFQDIYDFAGKIRTVNISKGNFRFASVIYLKEALKSIDNMPQTNFPEIIQKYIEMNIAHPFREGNGRSTRVWLDLILKKELKKVVDWSKINKEDYLLAMERSPIRDTEIKNLIYDVLTNEIDSEIIFMKGIDKSYSYEGYELYKIEELE